MRVGYELAIIISYPRSACRIIVLLKIKNIISSDPSRLYFVKTTDFQLVLNFAQTRSYHIWRAWYNGSYTMMAKPIRVLEFHYRMIQFLIMPVTSPFSLWKLRNTGEWNKITAFAKQNMFASIISVVTNNKNELYKTVRLTSLQKPQLQSVSIFFEFFHPCLLLYLLCHLYSLLTFWVLILIFHSVWRQMPLFVFW